MITFKVWPQGWGRECWRLITMQETETLATLATAIMDAFAFEDDTHLYEFIFKGKAWHPDRVAFVHPESDGKKADKIKIQALQLVPKQRFVFLFDFGDEWYFELRVDGVVEGGEEGILVSGRGEPPLQYPDLQDEA